MGTGKSHSRKGGEKWGTSGRDNKAETRAAAQNARSTTSEPPTVRAKQVQSTLAAAFLRACRSSARLETFPAEDGAALRGAEWNGGLFSASRAGGLGLNLGVAVGLSGGGGDTEDGDPFGLAGLATFGFVLELFVVKKKLFPGSENEITSTVDTFQHLVLKFH